MSPTLEMKTYFKPATWYRDHADLYQIYSHQCHEHHHFYSPLSMFNSLCACIHFMQSSDGLIYYFLTLKQIGLCISAAAVSMQDCSGVLQLTAGNDEVLRETCSGRLRILQYCRGLLRLLQFVT